MIPAVKAADALARAKQVLKTMESRHSVRSSSIGAPSSLILTKATTGAADPVRGGLQTRVSMQPRAGSLVSPNVPYEVRTATGNKDALLGVAGAREPRELAGARQLSSVNSAAIGEREPSVRAPLTRTNSCPFECPTINLHSIAAFRPFLGRKTSMHL
jgi:hypothetical protein